MDKIRERVEAGNVTLLPLHWAMIDAAAKDAGLLGRSAGLRMLLDRLARMERERAHLAQDACCAEEARATLEVQESPEYRALHGLETRREALARTDADRRAWDRCGEPDEVEG